MGIKIINRVIAFVPETDELGQDVPVMVSSQYNNKDYIKEPIKKNSFRRADLEETGQATIADWQEKFSQIREIIKADVINVAGVDAATFKGSFIRSE